MRYFKCTAGLAIFMLSITGTGYAQKTAPAYSLLKMINLKGDGKWDYMKVDEQKGRLFVAHFDKVHIVDLATGLQSGQIDSLQGVHGVAFALKQGKGYISNGLSNSVTVFDYKTLKVLKTIPVNGIKPDCIIFDEATEKIFTFCGGDGKAAVIDPEKDVQTGTIQIGGKCEFAVSDAKGHIYNNIETSNEVVVLDAKKLQVIQRYKLQGGQAPTGIAMDIPNNRLFIACSDSKTLVVMDASNGKEIATLPIGGKTDGVVFDNGLKLVITSDGEGSATIIQQQDANHYKVVQTLKTQPGMKTIANSSKTHQVFISGANMKEKEIVPGTFRVSVFGTSTK